MRTLVIGGGGFIGSHLCGRLLGKGHTVLCLDNFLTSPESNVADLAGRPAFQLIRHDISRPFQPEGPLDAVLHLASPASPPDYLRLPIETLQAGSLGTFNALEIAKAKGARFLLASTSEVYGDPQVHPQPESYWGHVNCVGPRSVYDEAKRFAEALTMAYHRAYRLDTRIARIFNTYGPRIRRNDGRAIPNFITQALGGRPITIYGDGSQTRSFCYVTDLAEGIERLMGGDLHDPVNLGNPNEISLIELARLILRLTQSRSSILFKPLPVDDPKLRCPEIRPARERLKWEPAVPLEEGLLKTID
ncbi:MAG: SDR family oxidoreductase, partial [Candidatus Omnitrophica bacterium]|nr:SDR family oxidoreductase [Candidatus Omnitrophota bacterium]